MKRFAKTMAGFVGLVLLVVLASGCSVTRRYVTHTVSGTGGPTSMASLEEARHTGGPDDEVPAEGSEPPAEGEETAEGDVAEAMPDEGAAPTTPTPTVAESATRWMYIAYAEVKETNFFIAKTLKTTSRVLRCLINDDNTVMCNEQADANRLFNPQDQ